MHNPILKLFSYLTIEYYSYLILKNERKLAIGGKAYIY